MKFCGPVFLFAVATFLAGATAQELPGPCREWLQPCVNGRWVCTSEYTYQQHIHGMQPLCPVPEHTPAPPTNLHCQIVNGTCQYTDSDLQCTTWVPNFQFSYTCGSVQERELAENQTSSHHFFIGMPPLPINQCLPINGSCQWYDPCYMWRGFCGGPYHCGNATVYYNFVFGPQPLCALPPEGLGGGDEVLPPGECVVNNTQCGWSNCTSFLDWCQTSWTCGTQYDKDVYFASPPPPCPAPPPGYHPPSRPGVCKFNLDEGRCIFETEETTLSPSPENCPVGTQPQLLSDSGTSCLATCRNYRGFEDCLVSECECPEGLYYDDETNRGCVPPDDCLATPATDHTTGQNTATAKAKNVCSSVICSDGYTCVPDSENPDEAICKRLSIVRVAAISGMSIGIVLILCGIVALLGFILLIYFKKQRLRTKEPAKTNTVYSDISAKEDPCKYSELKCEDSVSESSLEKNEGFVPQHSE